MGEPEVIQEKKKRRKKRRGLGAVRWREDIKKYVIDYYDRLGKRHVETSARICMMLQTSSMRNERDQERNV